MSYERIYFFFEIDQKSFDDLSLAFNHALSG